jgi:hypothetical protein
MHTLSKWLLVYVNLLLYYKVVFLDFCLEYKHNNGMTLLPDLQSWPKVFGTLQNYCMFLLFSSERVDLMKNKCLNQTPSPPPFNVDFGGILN